MKSKKDIESVISLLKETINTFDWITDFDKCLSNTNKYDKLYNDVKKLINSEKFEVDFILEFQRNKNIAKVFALMLSLRDDKPKSFISDKETNEVMSFDFKNCSNSASEYLTLIKETKLIEYLKEIDSFDIKSFIFGIECGLDSNARKNRSGKAMENFVKDYLQKYNLSFK